MPALAILNRSIITMNTTSATSSFRDRIAASKNRVAKPLAAALALGAAAPVAEAAIYTIASPSVSNRNIDPLDGSSALGSFSPNADNPIFLGACIGAQVMLDASLHGSSNFNFVTPPTDIFQNIQLLDAGATIDASSNFYDPGMFEYSTAPVTYDGSTLRYIGFRYTNQGVGLNETYFGWIEFTMPANDQLIVNRFAIGGNGQAIITGSDVSVVPEPGSAALLAGALALGAAGARRRRR